MKTLVIIAALLGALLADDNINIGNEGNDGDNVHQTVNINNQEHVASINSLNGWNSWNSIFDYERGVFATQLFGKKKCVVTKLDKAVFPTLEVLSKHKELPRAQPLVRYTISNQVPIANIGLYGVHVDALCRGIPSYSGDVIQVTEYIDGCDSNSIITIGGISFCF